MNEQQLEELLKHLQENQSLMKEKLNEAFFNSTNEEEKKEILGMIKLNEKVETAIENKDLITLQTLYANANTN